MLRLTRAAATLLLLALAGCRSQPDPATAAGQAPAPSTNPVRDDPAAPYGGLRVQLRGGTDGRGGGDGPVVVLLHGYGAAGDDLVGFERALAVAPDVRYVFPEAPLERPPRGRAWWPVDLAALERARAEGRSRDLSGSTPEGMPEARARVLALLRDLPARLSVPPERVVVGGFSQGAMLAMDVALHHDGPLAAVLVWSGTLVAEAEWRPLLARRRGLPVLISHGRSDPLLPFEGAERLASLCRDAGLDVTFVPFDGGHAIVPEVRERSRDLLRRTLAPR